MPAYTQDDDLQLQTLKACTILHALRPATQLPVWPGALILNIGLAPTGSAISLAANIAGAVCLSLESDPALLRNAQRTGACDFIVTTVDEALRAMKNELRKRRPLSVGLEGDPAVHLADITGRGLAPQLFTTPDAYPEAATHFQSLGAVLVSFGKEQTFTPRTDVSNATSILEAFVTPRLYHMHTETCATSAELRAFDTHALAALPPDDPLRRQWLLTAPRLFPRDRHRTLWLTVSEQNSLTTDH